MQPNLGIFLSYNLDVECNAIHGKTSFKDLSMNISVSFQRICVLKQILKRIFYTLRKQKSIRT